ncbi:hypothetical protein EGC77_20510 [Shewanella psychromarinicola]|uniref:Uncharacterized protein n=1 Tax=Shewanella psychromarinicola TaxID=2487742 RepID=A0A3N4DE89_9GAMM|nr:hypothetical protein EGC77_20510 [Shewanella psychromarinicola]
MVPEARLFLITESGTPDVQQERGILSLTLLFSLNFRHKKAPTNVEAFLHHSLLLEVIMVPEARLFLITESGTPDVQQEREGFYL